MQEAIAKASSDHGYANKWSDTQNLNHTTIKDENIEIGSYAMDISWASVDHSVQDRQSSFFYNDNIR